MRVNEFLTEDRSKLVMATKAEEKRLDTPAPEPGPLLKLLIVD
jgi:hypothetical protein